MSKLHCPDCLAISTWNLETARALLEQVASTLREHDAANDDLAIVAARLRDETAELILWINARATDG